MARYLDAVADHTDALVVSAQVDSLADVLERDRVGIGVKLDAGLLRDDERDDEVGFEGVRGQRAEAWALDQQALRGALPCGAWRRSLAVPSRQAEACARTSSSEANDRP